MSTAAPDWVSLALQICEIVCDPGHEYPTFQPVVAAAPELVTVNPSWNPPDQELVTDQVTWQPPVGVGAGVGVGVGVEVGVGVAVEVGVGVGVGVGLGEGADPVPDSTTIDWAGTETEPLERLLVAMAGLAAE